MLDKGGSDAYNIYKEERRSGGWPYRKVKILAVRAFTERLARFYKAYEQYYYRAYDDSYESHHKASPPS